MSPTDIRMTLPAESRFIATTRVTAASIAAELGFSVDQIDELRMGVNELVSTVIEWAEDHDQPAIDLLIQVTDETIEVEASTGQPVSRQECDELLDALTRQILEVVVDSHQIDGGYGRISKRRSAA